MKKLCSLGLAVALTATLVTGAAAQGYGKGITVNGAALDTKALPPSDLYPLRLIVEADHGYADWFKEENQAFFSVDSTRITVTFPSNELSVDNVPVKDAKVQVVNGITFVGEEVLAKIPGYKVTEDKGTTTITTPNSDPVVSLCYDIMEETKMARLNKNSAADLEKFFGFKMDNFSQLVAFTPMMINSDSVIIGKVSGDKTQAKADLQKYQDQQIKNFEQYLPGPLEMAKNGKIVEHGDYLMLIISPDTAKAISLFEAAL